LWKRGRAHVAIWRWATRADLPRPPGDTTRSPRSTCPRSTSRRPRCGAARPALARGEVSVVCVVGGVRCGAALCAASVSSWGGTVRAVQLGHEAQLSGRLAADGHLRAGAPYSRSRVGRRHTAATQALEADPACLGRCLSWTCARRSSQGHRLVHHGYQNRSRTSTFSTHISHVANQC
jgi:hypothetical protein